jgi:hypothetical protein
MVFGLSKREREERARQAAADREARIIAERQRRAGYRQGMVEQAKKQGIAEAKSGKKRGGLSGALGTLGNAYQGFSDFGANYSANFERAMGGAPPPRKKKGKKRTYDDPFANFY